MSYRWENQGWIGVDLDGTLADGSVGQSGMEIGPPVPRMEQRVRAWMFEGIRVKIMTARAARPEMIPQVVEWLKKHKFVYGNGQVLEVTNQKDFLMLQLWDDRAVQVVPDTGMSIEEHIMEQLADGEIPEAMK